MGVQDDDIVPPQRRPRAAVSTEEDPWLFTHEELTDTPSRVAGLAKELEDETHARTSRYIRDCAKLLNIPDLTAAIAATFMRRFYMLESITDHNTAHVASASLFLACKVAETHKRLRDFIAETVRARTRDVGKGTDGVDILEDGTSYSEEKNAMLAKEAELMRVLNFDLTVDTPFPCITHLYKVYICNLEAPGVPEMQNAEMQRTASQNAWCFLLESIGMYIHVRYDSREIATAAVFLAVRMAGLPVEGKPGTPKYYEVYKCDLNNVDAICNALLDLFDPDASFR